VTLCAPSSWGAVFKLLLTLVALAASTAAFSGGGAAVAKSITIFKAGTYTKTATSIAALTASDLRHASKAENVAGLLDLAQNENRIDAVQAIQLSGSYSGLRKGDDLLLICLKNAKCQPDSFYASAKNSDLHAAVLARAPALGATQANHAVGAVNEGLMLRFFENSGWKAVDGQVGRTGFDGLLVKVDDAGTVRDLLIVESKYNTSTLKTTNHGTQMSDEWVRKKIQDLRSQSPDADIYRQIESLVESGAYRARLWNMTVENGKASIELKSVHSKDGTLSLRGVEDAERPPLVIDIRAPKNDFDRRFASWYREEMDLVVSSQR
jgi:hypothetical protein